MNEAGNSLDDVGVTRMHATNVKRDWEEIGAAHGKLFGSINPAITLVGGELLMDWVE